MKLKVNVFLSDKNMKEGHLTDVMPRGYPGEWIWAIVLMMSEPEIALSPFDIRKPYTIVPCRVTPEGEPVSDSDFMDMARRASEAGYMVAI